MSRSFHTTRRHLEYEEKVSYSDEKKRIASIEKLKEDLEKKRRTKRHVRYQRKGSLSNIVSTPVDLIPIEVSDRSDYLHYPATADDIRDFLNILPAGIPDGLSRICLCLGKERQTEPEDTWEEDYEIDPYCHRIGYEILPGIYAGRSLGAYNPAKAEINIYGYVYESSIPSLSIYELYLRLYMLMTLIHELGHHYDFTYRIGRGRWRCDNKDNVEIYAEHIQHKWLKEYALPFLRKKYADDVNALNSWTEKHVGIEIPLELIAGDPRSTAKNGRIRVDYLFDTAHPFQRFVHGTGSGEDILEVRLEFADELHMAEKYDLALAIIELVLEEDPQYVDAITVKADIYKHLGKYDDAIDTAKLALSIEPNYMDAFGVLSITYEDMKEWGKVIEISDEVLTYSKDCLWALYSKAAAFLEIGKYNEAEAILREFEEGGEQTQKVAQRLRETIQKKLKG